MSTTKKCEHPAHYRYQVTSRDITSDVNLKIMGNDFVHRVVYWCASCGTLTAGDTELVPLRDASGRT